MFGMKQKYKVLKIALAILISFTFLGRASDVYSSETVSSKVGQGTSNVLTQKQYEHSSALELAKMVRDKKVTSQQLINFALAKIKQDNPQLNAVITLREAKALDEANAMVDTGQPFYGVPILIKGLAQELKGEPATQGLPYSSKRVAAYTKPFVSQLQSLGFIVIGQTNYPELGLTNVTTSKLYGPASNPWNTAYNPGGSSGGSAAAVTDNIVPLATGNDAGGSTRIPASWSGVIGLKPTSGMINGDSPTSPMASFAETKSMADTETLFNHMLSGKVVANATPENLKQLTIAYSTKSPVETPVSQDAIDAVSQAVAFLRSQGFHLKEVDSPVDGKALMMAYYKSATGSGFAANSFAKSTLKRELLPDDGSPMTYALYEASKKLTSSDRQQVLQTIADTKRKMADFHLKYPLYLTPTTATTAPSNSDPAFLPEYVEKIKHISALSSSGQMQLIYDAWLHGLSKTPFTQLANVAGEPAISLPTYVSASGMPLGIQFEATKGQDRTLISIGKLFESSAKLKLRDDYLKHQEGDENQISTVVPNTVSEPVPNPFQGNFKGSKMKPKLLAKNPHYVYAKTAVNLYNNSNLNKKLKHYRKMHRVNAITFRVLDVINSTGGAIRYQVSGGYISASSKIVAPLYYQHNPIRVRVIGKQGVNQYTDASLTDRKSVKLKKGRILNVEEVVSVGSMTRLKLTNGNFITANKKMLIKSNSY